MAPRRPTGSQPLVGPPFRKKALKKRGTGAEIQVGSGRLLVWAQTAVAAPALARQPGSWRRDRRSRCGRVERDRPTVQPPSRGPRLDDEGARVVVAEILEHVDDRVPHLAWRGEGSLVTTVL